MVLATLCVPLGYGLPEDSLKLVDRAGVKRVVGQVMVTGGGSPAYRMEDGMLKVRIRHESENVAQAFYPVGIAFDLPQGQRTVRVEVSDRAWQCGK